STRVPSTGTHLPGQCALPLDPKYPLALAFVTESLLWFRFHRFPVADHKQSTNMLCDDPNSIRFHLLIACLPFWAPFSLAIDSASRSKCTSFVGKNFASFWFDLALISSKTALLPSVQVHRAAINAIQFAALPPPPGSGFSG